MGGVAILALLCKNSYFCQTQSIDIPPSQNRRAFDDDRLRRKEGSNETKSTFYGSNSRIDFCIDIIDNMKKNTILVRRKPVKCPHCGGKVLRIAYGDPGPEMLEAANRGEIILGGCLISDESPDYACPDCGQTFRKVE